jgi:hypothetical protein
MDSCKGTPPSVQIQALLFLTYATRKIAGAGGIVGEAGIGSTVGGTSVVTCGGKMDKAVNVEATVVPRVSNGFEVGTPPGMAHARLTRINRETADTIRNDFFIFILFLMLSILGDKNILPQPKNTNYYWIIHLAFRKVYWPSMAESIALERSS